MLHRHFVYASLTAALLPLVGCHIESYGDGWGVDFDEADRGTVCAAFCNHLNDCGNVTSSGYAKCFDQCETAFDQDEDETRDGCACVVHGGCHASGTYSCEGAPIPDGPGTTTGGSDAGTTPDTTTPPADTTGGGTPTLHTCTTDGDCAWSEDCVTGYCLLRCKSSCECHAGESCLNAYCSVAIAVSKPCGADCDCPAGGKCVANLCK